METIFMVDGRVVRTLDKPVNVFQGMLVVPVEGGESFLVAGAALQIHANGSCVTLVQLIQSNS